MLQEDTASAAMPSFEASLSPLQIYTSNRNAGADISALASQNDGPSLKKRIFETATSAFAMPPSSFLPYGFQANAAVSAEPAGGEATIIMASKPPRSGSQYSPPISTSSSSHPHPPPAHSSFHVPTHNSTSHCDSKVASDFFGVVSHAEKGNAVVVAASYIGKCQKSRGHTRRCETAGCIKGALKGGLCGKCGGGARCTSEDCEKLSLPGGKPGLCGRCGGGRRCNESRCSKLSLKGGKCGKHGGGNRCTSDGCGKLALKGGKCVHCGGGTRCNSGDCHRLAVREGLCRKCVAGLLKRLTTKTPAPSRAKARARGRGRGRTRVRAQASAPAPHAPALATSTTNATAGTASQSDDDNAAAALSVAAAATLMAASSSKYAHNHTVVVSPPFGKIAATVDTKKVPTLSGANANLHAKTYATNEGTTGKTVRGSTQLSPSTFSSSVAHQLSYSQQQQANIFAEMHAQGSAAWSSQPQPAYQMRQMPQMQEIQRLQLGQAHLHHQQQQHMAVQQLLAAQMPMGALSGQSNTQHALQQLAMHQLVMNSQSTAAAQAATSHMGPTIPSSMANLPFHNFLQQMQMPAISSAAMANYLRAPAMENAVDTAESAVVAAAQAAASAAFHQQNPSVNPPVNTSTASQVADMIMAATYAFKSGGLFETNV